MRHSIFRISVRVEICGSIHTLEVAHTHKELPMAPRRRQYISIRETADYLGVSTRTVRQMIADRRLRAYRNGRVIRLDLAEVDASMQPMAGGAA